MGMIQIINTFYWSAPCSYTLNNKYTYSPVPSYGSVNHEADVFGKVVHTVDVHDHNGLKDGHPEHGDSTAVGVHEVKHILARIGTHWQARTKRQNDTLVEIGIHISTTPMRRGNANIGQFYKKYLPAKFTNVLLYCYLHNWLVIILKKAQKAKESVELLI